MVKRIKKRIPKQDADGELEGEFAAGAEGSAADGALVASGVDDDGLNEPPDIRAQLEDMADDGFTRKTASAFGWLIEKKTMLIGIAAVVVVGVGIYMFTQRSKNAAAEEAAAAFQVGADPYVEASRTADDAEKRKAGIAKAAGAFETARTQYKDRRISALATLGMAGVNFDQGKADEAQALYTEFLARPDTDPFAKAIALQGKAVALEQKGDLAGASDAWKAMEGLSRDAYGLIANVQIGRLLEVQGKGDAAKAHYAKVQTDFAKSLEDLPNRGMKAQIERRLTALSGGPT
ncbi:MAG: putative negative regulator of RcsB-dependent stress response [Bradymonadia bacterium]